MEQGLQKLNVDQHLEVWAQGIADCRSSGKGNKHWCKENSISKKTYYYSQRRIFRMAQEQQPSESAEFHSFRPVSAVTASLEISAVNV